MNKYRTTILILLISINHHLNGQRQSATIQTTYELIDGDINFSIKVNGLDVSKSNTAYSIPLNKIGFDTIEVSFHNNPKSYSIMKMQQGQIYELKSNSCSMYVISPKDEPKIGMVQFRIESKDSTYYVVKVDGLSERKINRETIDEFYYTPPSAMCQFSAKSIVIESDKGEKLQRIPFHFLHGELVGVLYKEETNSVEINLYGYIRNENDYRYKYDYDEKE